MLVKRPHTKWWIIRSDGGSATKTVFSKGNNCQWHILTLVNLDIFSERFEVIIDRESVIGKDI